MIWIVNIIFVILLTGVTGSLLFAAWRLISCFARGVGINVAYWILKCLTMLQMLCLIALSVRLCVWMFGIGRRAPKLNTPMITVSCGVLFAIWIVGICVRCRGILSYAHQSRRFYSGLVPADADETELFRQVCQAAGLRAGHVQLYMNHYLPCGASGGVIHRKVFLPEQLDECEYRYTAVHEMIHCRHRDTLFKCVAIALQTVYWFCPMIRSIQRHVSRWCEYACDYEVCIRMGNVREYGDVLLQATLRSDCIREILVGFADSEMSELRRRLVFMKTFGQQKKRAAAFSIAAVCMMSVLGTGVVFAASEVSSGGYNTLYDVTSVENIFDLEEEAEVTETEYPDNSNINPEDYVNTGVIFRDVLPLDGYTIVNAAEGRSISTFGFSKSINWTIASEEMVTSPIFYASSGSIINVSARINPSNIPTRVGVIYPDGTRYCVYVNGDYSRNYDVPRSGYYFVYAINDSSNTITVTGYYNVY